MFRISALHVNPNLPSSEPLYKRAVTLFLLCDQLNCTNFERGEYDAHPEREGGKTHDQAVQLFLNAKQLEGWRISLELQMCPLCGRTQDLIQEQARKQQEARRNETGVSLHSAGDLKKIEEAKRRLENATGRRN